MTEEVKIRWRGGGRGEDELVSEDFVEGLSQSWRAAWAM